MSPETTPDDRGAGVIDAHLHIWDPSRHRYDWLGPQHAPIDRTVTAEEAIGVLRRAGVSQALLVQAADTDEDTDAMLAAARAHSELIGVVAFVPLDDPRMAAARLESLLQDPLVVGVRSLVHDRPDPDWILRPAAREILDLIDAAGLVFDLPAVLPAHLKHIPELAHRHPGLRIVLDHLGKPPVGAAGPWAEGEWERLVRRLGPLPTVSAKLSGLQSLGTDAAAWSPDQVRPFVEVALDVFGPDRMLFGGDWPVSELSGGYRRIIDSTTNLLSSLDPLGRAAVLGGTARRVYGLGTR
ncbi:MULTISPECIES: amidohydrolase family protein [unclassified Rathayibacter]|uniref:amidohydrolase family protein n=1 Tax=unclassified Rathayibacter TaxID=2609250 RepID=UPI00104813F0|nr:MULTISPECIES: amidohydrolase family protein [unclassified Rathayibacter]TCL79474.1 L-fuconolactonase [Rathayibacter sp. PhB192]TCM25257.1 L-fuconolactonase [Rathayibacter sp. PhB179]